jgi:hypothetical protein
MPHVLLVERARPLRQRPAARWIPGRAQALIRGGPVRSPGSGSVHIVAMPGTVSR